MTKKEYIEQLSQALNRFSPSTKTEVLEDYEAHFAEGLDNGRTEEEICDELGPIDLFIEELSQMEPVSAASSHPAPAARPAKESSSCDSSDPCEYHISGASRLVLNGLHAEVSLSQSSDDQFHIYYEFYGTARQRSQFRFYCREENGVIQAGIRKSMTINGFFTSIMTPSISLKVYIPFSMTEVSVSTVSGDIDVVRLHIPVLCLTSTSGDISCDRTHTQQLEVSTTSGDIDEDHLLTSSLQTSTVSGDVTIDSARFDSCDIGTVSGDIEMSTRYDSTLNVHTVSGDIDFYSYAGIQGSIGSVSGDIEIHFEGTHAGFSIDFSTVSGDIEVNHESTVQHFRRGGHADLPGEGNYELSVSTTSGDITIF